MKLELTCKPWELAEKLGLNHYYTFYDGNVNGAIRFYDDKEHVATFAVVAEHGMFRTFRQTIRLIEGQWPPKSIKREQKCQNTDCGKRWKEETIRAFCPSCGCSMVRAQEPYVLPF